MDRRPTLIIAGAGKSGSSTLWRVLAQHPDIAMSVSKEPGYFHQHFDQPIDAFYAGQFPHATTQRVRGEATIGYLPDPDAPGRIAETVPDVRLLFILRDPVSRAISHYHWRRSHGQHREPLEAVVARGHAAVEIDRSRYGFHLGRWYDCFDRSQIHVVTTEGLAGSSGATIRSILGFVDVDVDHPIEVSRENQAVEARSERLAGAVIDLRRKRWMPAPGRRALSAVARRNHRPAAAGDVDPALRDRLYELLVPEIETTERLVGLDLSAWRRRDETPVGS